MEVERGLGLLMGRHTSMDPLRTASMGRWFVSTPDVRRAERPYQELDVYEQEPLKDYDGSAGIPQRKSAATAAPNLEGT